MTPETASSATRLPCPCRLWCKNTEGLPFPSPMHKGKWKWNYLGSCPDSHPMDFRGLLPPCQMDSSRGNSTGSGCHCFSTLKIMPYDNSTGSGWLFARPEWRACHQRQGFNRRIQEIPGSPKTKGREPWDWSCTALRLLLLLLFGLTSPTLQGTPRWAQPTRAHNALRFLGNTEVGLPFLSSMEQKERSLPESCPNFPSSWTAAHQNFHP